jgi:acetylornithine deacetylase
MAAYHLIHALGKLEAEWNERAKADHHFKALTHPINFNPGIIKGGDWASSVPAWCDVDCRIAILPGWKVADAQAEILACVSAAARDHRFLSNNPPEWNGPAFCRMARAEGSAAPEAAFGKAFNAVYGGAVEDLVFTALTDTRFYGLNYDIPSLCFGASGAAMHGFNEYVDLDSLRKSTKATALFIAEWCGVEAI